MSSGSRAIAFGFWILDFRFWILWTWVLRHQENPTMHLPSGLRRSLIIKVDDA
ncbi:MAG: hypothetical protein VKJ64_16990 [Leptolyngbyaceae bacterium]|nr:hypothetical protein [Leptolyngbyaceae bacterium]